VLKGVLFSILFNYFTTKMFEAKFASSVVLKKVLEAIKDLLTDAQWECTETGMSLQVTSINVVQAFVNWW